MSRFLTPLKNKKYIESLGIVSDAGALIEMGYSKENFLDANISMFVWYLKKIKEQITDKATEIDISCNITPHEIALIGSYSPVKVITRKKKKVIVDSDAMKFALCLPEQYRNSYIVNILSRFEMARYFSIDALETNKLLQFKTFLRKIENLDSKEINKNIYKIHPSLYQAIAFCELEKIFTVCKKDEQVYIDGKYITDYAEDLIRMSQKIYDGSDYKFRSIEQVVNNTYNDMRKSEEVLKNFH